MSYYALHLKLGAERGEWRIGPDASCESYGERRSFAPRGIQRVLATGTEGMH